MTAESLFSLSEHPERLSKAGDRLEVPDATVDFEYSRGWLVEGLGSGDGSRGGRPPFDPVSMFKVLIVQARHNPGDARMEFMIRDRLSRMRFPGFDPGGRMPDGNTIRHFRNRMTGTGTLKRVMRAFDRRLHKRGCIPMSGQIIDATLVPAPGQRNDDSEKEAVKAGKTAREIRPDKPDKAARKDVDARWTLRIGGKIRHRPDGTRRPRMDIPVLGYKSHIGIDRKYGFIRKATVTSAAAPDGRRSRYPVDKENMSSKVWADSACRSQANEKWLSRRRSSQIHRREPRGKPMPGHMAESNARKSSVRAVAEHVFARQKGGFGLFIRTVGPARAGTKPTLANPACNFRRPVFHETRIAMGQVRPKHHKTA